MAECPLGWAISLRSQPLNARQEFSLWPHFSPGEWLDFNPTVVELPNARKIAIFRRNKIPPVPGQTSIWMVEVDDALFPITPPKMLIDLGEDPRAVVVQDKLFLFYVVIEKDLSGRSLGSSMMLAEFFFESAQLQIHRIHRLPKNPTGKLDPQKTTWEKNWVPFSCDRSHICLIYTHEPWRILVLNIGSESSVPSFICCYEEVGISWKYGEIRGGTTPVRFDDGSLITFFHSSRVLGSRSVYMVGACVFSDRAPYQPIFITTEPLLISPYHSFALRFGWRVLVSAIFPLGALKETLGYRLLAGIDDGEVGSFYISNDTLAKRLSPITGRIKNPQSPALQGVPTSLSEGVVFTPHEAQTNQNVAIARFLSMMSADDKVFLNIGAQEGVYEIILQEGFARCIAVERVYANYLEGNIALNRIKNIQVISDDDDMVRLRQGILSGETKEWQSIDVGLLRVNSEDPIPTLKDLEWLLEKNFPITLIQSINPLNIEAIKKVMNLFGYYIEQPFLHSSLFSVLCIQQKHKDLFPWMLK